MSDHEEFFKREQAAREEAERQGTEQAFKDAYQKTLDEDIKEGQADGTAAREAQDSQTEQEEINSRITWEGVNADFFEGLDSITDSPFGELMNGVIYAAMETSRLTAAEIMPVLEKALDAGIQASGYSTQMNTEAANNDYLREHLSANENEAGGGAERTAGAGI